LAVGLKRDPLTDAEVEHVRVGAHLAEKPQACHDAIVEIDASASGQLDAEAGEGLMRGEQWS
jgi:hypothetical protein